MRVGDQDNVKEITAPFDVQCLKCGHVYDMVQNPPGQGCQKCGSSNIRSPPSDKELPVWPLPSDHSYPGSSLDPSASTSPSPNSTSDQPPKPPSQHTFSFGKVKP